MEVPPWDDYFMTMVYHVASRSKDKRAHIGAVIVNPQKRVISTGYNGFARGIRDDVPERHEKPEKYFYTIHAEENAILNAPNIALEGCVMYTQGTPCSGCAKTICQKGGIVEIVIDKNWDDDNSEKWREEAKRSLEMFSEKGINLRPYTPSFVQLNSFHHGIRTPLITI